MYKDTISQRLFLNPYTSGPVKQYFQDQSIYQASVRTPIIKGRPNMNAFVGAVTLIACITLCDLKGNHEYDQNTQTKMEAIAAAGRASGARCSYRAQPKVLKNSLIPDNLTRWYEVLFEAVCRTSRHSATKVTSFELIYGQEVVLRVEVYLDAYKFAKQTDLSVVEHHEQYSSWTMPNSKQRPYEASNFCTDEGLVYLLYDMHK